MSYKTFNVFQLLSQEEELNRLLPLLHDIAIVEYDGENIDVSRGVLEWLESKNVDNKVVKRIVLCGRKTLQLKENEQQLLELYPDSEIKLWPKPWPKLDIAYFNFVESLVFHSGVGKNVKANYFNEKYQFDKIVDSSRVIYQAVVLLNNTNSPSDGGFITSEFSLKSFKADKAPALDPPSKFCLEKQDFMQVCLKTLTPHDYTFQILEEAEQGCEFCNQSENYSRRKHCPIAQLAVAQLYQDGRYVPKNERIAHQWKMMAAKQGYREAKIKVADDFAQGNGCEARPNEALSIYVPYARQGDNYCMKKIVGLADDGSINPRLAIPFISILAQAGDEDMILKLSDAFQEGDLGLPCDMKQQEEWIRVGAENGKPRFVKAMAQMYEANEMWLESYKWYCKLKEVGPDLLPDGKLEEIQTKMLTHGLTPHEIAVNGMNYLYGYHRQERNTNFALGCLSVASEKGVVLAQGQLGIMHFNGIEVERNTSKGLELLNKAASAGDLLSIDKLIEINEENNFHAYKDRWRDKVLNVVNEKTSSQGKDIETAIAYYIKAKYLIDGVFYNKNQKEAFWFMNLAANLKYPVAIYRLAVMCRDGIGTEADDREYERQIKMAAQEGHYEAMGIYGVLIYESWHEDNVKSFSFLHGAFQQGYYSNDAYWCLARCYMNGEGTTADKKRAYEMYHKAAQDGKAQAQVELCDAYFKGNEWVEKDMEQCAKWGEEAIKQGRKVVRFKTAYALSRIGKTDRALELYLELAEEGDRAAMNNYAVNITNLDEKVRWLKKAVDKGEDYAMWNLGKLYLEGEGVEKDTEKGVDLIIKGAEYGCIGAINDLAYKYRYGIDVEQNTEEALKWYKKGVEDGDSDSMCSLASMYYEGTLVSRDVDKAIYYYKLAAEKGDSNALYALGVICHNQGSASDINKAIYWYRKAALAGNDAAKKKLKALKVNWIEDDQITN